MYNLVKPSIYLCRWRGCWLCLSRFARKKGTTSIPASSFACYKLVTTLATKPCLIQLGTTLATIPCLIQLGTTLAAITCLLQLGTTLAAITCLLQLGTTLAAITCLIQLGTTLATIPCLLQLGTTLAAITYLLQLGTTLANYVAGGDAGGAFLATLGKKAPPALPPAPLLATSWVQR